MNTTKLRRICRKINSILGYEGREELNELVQRYLMDNNWNIEEATLDAESRLHDLEREPLYDYRLVELFTLCRRIGEKLSGVPNTEAMMQRFLHENFQHVDDAIKAAQKELHAMN